MTVIAEWQGVPIDPDLLAGYGHRETITVNGESWPRWLGYHYAAILEAKANVASVAQGYVAASTTSVAIGTGSKTFTATTGKAFAAGMWVMAYSAADATNYIAGTVTSYSATTGALVLSSLATGGSGTKTDWVITLSGRGAQGGAGAQGPSGSGSTIHAALNGTLQTASPRPTFNFSTVFSVADNAASSRVDIGLSLQSSHITAALGYTPLQSNQTITLSGDATGSGTTAITVTLPTVNGTVGTYGGASAIPVITVDAKGRITAVTTASPASAVASFNGRTGAVTLASSDVTGALAYVPASTGSNTLSGDQNLQDYKVVRAVLQDTAAVSQGLGSGSGTRTIDLEQGNFASLTVAGVTTIAISNPPATGRVGVVVLEITNGGSAAVSFPASFKWPNGAVPSLTAAGVDLIGAITRDAGTTWRVAMVAQDIR